MRSRSETRTLPLLPLQAVLFPGGMLSLKVFEARYVDLVSSALRERTAFGIVAVRQDPESGRVPDPGQFEPVGVMAELMDVDAEHAGILQVRARGMHRFDIVGQSQRDDGVWVADTQPRDGDTLVAPAPEQLETVRSLANAIGTLKQQGSEPFLKPFHFEDAGWVANRWCEILPISVAAKQRLMALEDPSARLQLVVEFLRNKGVVG